MTESQWLTSEDPSAMLAVFRHPEAAPLGDAVRLSDRKLRLFACAVTRLGGAMSPDIQEAVEVAESSVDKGTPLRWTKSIVVCYEPAAEAARLALSDLLRQHDWGAQAELLRDIAGNPFWPAAVLPRDLAEVLGRGTQSYRQEDIVLGDWLTPQVLDLALAAYEERERKCEKCKGKGSWTFGLGGFATERCLDCHGNGTIDDGTLDPARLAILSDALEEAGCPTKVVVKKTILVTLWSANHAWNVGVAGPGIMAATYRDKRRANVIAWATKAYRVKKWVEHRRSWSGDGVAEETMPHPLLEHLRGGGPHVRGCWVLDLLLGKQ